MSTLKGCLHDILGTTLSKEVDLVVEYVLSKQQAGGANEFLIGIIGDTVNIVPLRMGYELPDMPWAKNCRPLYALCIKGKVAEYRTVQGLKDSVSRLPKLPCSGAGAAAIIKAVTRVLVNRTLEAHEPPWPKNDPDFWPCWSRYCRQGNHPTLGAWLDMAILRIKESETNAA
ncbi:TPA: hypothetical protein R0E72_004437 [Aeromonas hydrophila subsp. hydrophila]|uniref:hypothetical protein n=2 Tax=Aeromonadaceae TaxID=84642 RepID=UPI0029294B2A|nr:hypothetical protein [Aeromonas caviae]MDX7767268.1 hypothetical protein [Aeromonas caviae]HEB5079607.1 hypothetical protein [Aeromonas hydrophila subsp. hydrophila]